MPRSIGTLMLAEARKHIGAQENPPGSNKGAEIRKFKAATWLDPDQPWPWCQAFANYVWEKTTGRKSPYPTAAVRQFWAYAGTNQAYFEQIPKSGGPLAGDFAIIGNNDSFDHITLVDKVLRDHIAGIGGNQNHRVQVSHYGYSQIVGYVRAWDVTNQLPPVKPKKPLYEVVTGEGGQSRVVATGSRFNIAKIVASKSAYWIKTNGGFRVRTKKP